MRITTLSVLGLMLAGSAVLGACADTTTTFDVAQSDTRHDATQNDVRDVIGTDVRPDTGPDVRDVVVPVDVPRDTGRMCPATCTTNLECQSNCPIPSTGTYCCDTTSHYCYQPVTGTCGTVTTDSGVPPY